MAVSLRLTTCLCCFTSAGLDAGVDMYCLLIDNGYGRSEAHGLCRKASRKCSKSIALHAIDISADGIRA